MLSNLSSLIEFLPSYVSPIPCSILSPSDVAPFYSAFVSYASRPPAFNTELCIICKVSYGG